jgi:hypothetical protein
VIENYIKNFYNRKNAAKQTNKKPFNWG